MKRAREDKEISHEQLIKENIELKETVAFLTKRTKELEEKCNTLTEEVMINYSCYACSTVDDAKYECEDGDCESLMCIDHSEQCAWCGHGSYCSECVNATHYCPKCREKEVEKCCRDCGEVKDRRERACSVCKSGEDEDEQEHNPLPHKDCKNSKIIWLCLSCLN